MAARLARPRNNGFVPTWPRTPPSCTLAYWHEPRFASGDSDTTYDAFWRALYDAKVDVVLNGHEHFYERFAA